jgi:hypothetical protein
VIYTDFFNKFGSNSYSKSTFINQHGEKFIVIKTKTVPQMYLFTGDETDWEVKRLFSSEFDLWDNDEISKLASALKRLSKEK